jgi:hypothetical protein
MPEEAFYFPSKGLVVKHDGTPLDIEECVDYLVAGLAQAAN